MDSRGGDWMGRTGVLLAIAVIGYFIGVAGYYLLKNLSPWLEQVLPMLLQAEWVISGLFGAVFAVILVVIWSYTTKE
jgi:hypothetical protein